MAVNLTQEDVAGLTTRLEASEARLAEMQTRIEAQSVELAASSSRHNQLIVDLRTTFDAMAVEFEAMKERQQELESHCAGVRHHAKIKTRAPKP